MADGRLAHENEACAAFYRDVLGLPVLAEFRGHDDGQAPPEPTAEHQFVLYHGDAGALARAEARPRGGGPEPLRAENPYWSRRGAVAFADPDGWVVILAPWAE